MTSRPTFIVVNCLYLAIVVAMVRAAFNYGGEGSIVSLVIGIPTLAMLIYVFATQIIGGKEMSTENVNPDEATTAPWSRAGVICAWLLIVFSVVFFLGFYPAIFLFTLAYLKLEGKTSWPTAAVTAGILFGVLYLSFDYVMGQELFKGILFNALVPVF